MIIPSDATFRCPRSRSSASGMGLHQGSALSSVLFSKVTDEVSQLTVMFTDDIVILHVARVGSRWRKPCRHLHV